MSKKNSSNENSPYWNKVGNQNWMENPRANPDLLSEAEALFPKSILTPQQEEQYSLYLKAIERVKFSFQQKIVWELFSLKGYTVTRMASQLGLDKSTISRTLKTAIEKLRFQCEKIKQSLDNNDMSGFQKGITIKGHTDIDPLFKERMEQHKLEIDTFYKEHPELKEGKRKKDEDK